MEEYRCAGQVLAWSTIRWLRQVKIIKIVGQVFVWPQPELAFGKTLMTVNSIWLTRSAAPSTALCDVIIITRTFRSRRLDWKTKIHFLIYLSAARVKCNKIQHLFGHKSKERQFSKIEEIQKFQFVHVVLGGFLSRDWTGKKTKQSWMHSFLLISFLFLRVYSFVSWDVCYGRMMRPTSHVTLNADPVERIPLFLSFFLFPFTHVVFPLHVRANLSLTRLTPTNQLVLCSVYHLHYNNIVISTIYLGYILG